MHGKVDATPNVSGGRIFSLQALRGIAASLVVVAHAIEHAPGSAPNPIILTGRFGVEIFFVISGFVIAYVAGSGVFSPSSFLARRVWRVAPLYWGLTFLVAGLAFIAPSIFQTTKFDAAYLIKSLLFIPSPLPGTEDWRPLFKLGWTLNYEIFFYIVISALFWCRTMLVRALCLSAILGVLVLRALIVGPSPGLVSFYASLNLLPFIAGVWLAVAWRKGLVQVLPRYAGIVAVVAAVGLTLWFYQFPYDRVKYTIGHLAMSSAAIAIVLSALLGERFIANFKLSTWLGDISYSLYLVHMFVVGAGWAVMNRLGLKLVSVPGAIGVLVIVAGAVLAADITYRLFERPLMRFSPGRKKEPLAQEKVISVQAPQGRETQSDPT